MSNEMIAILITSLISLASLVISINNYLINKPKLKVIISDKDCDAYFGDVCAKDDKVVSTNVAALEINIVNNSPVDIFIKDIKLKIKDDFHRLVDNSNPFWEDVYFFYYNDQGEKEWDGAGINYSLRGVQAPITVKSYTILSGVCLFYDFPNVYSRKKYGKVVLNTAVGKIGKRVKFIKYDSSYISSEMKDVKIYTKNIK
jgi:hypothetical protein